VKATADESEVLVAVDDVVARDVLAVDLSVLSTLSNGLGVASDDVTEIDGVVKVCDENVVSMAELGVNIVLVLENRISTASEGNSVLVLWLKFGFEAEPERVVVSTLELALVLVLAVNGVGRGNEDTDPSPEKLFVTVCMAVVLIICIVTLVAVV